MFCFGMPCRLRGIFWCRRADARTLNLADILSQISKPWSWLMQTSLKSRRPPYSLLSLSVSKPSPFDPLERPEPLPSRSYVASSRRPPHPSQPSISKSTEAGTMLSSYTTVSAPNSPTSLPTCVTSTSRSTPSLHPSSSSSDSAPPSSTSLRQFGGSTSKIHRSPRTTIFSAWGTRSPSPQPSAGSPSRSTWTPSTRSRPSSPSYASPP